MQHDFWNILADRIHNSGFLTCPADLYLWMKPIVRPKVGFVYYAYVLIYVEDVVVIHHNAENVLRKIYKYFKLKPISIGDPAIHLGYTLNKMLHENGVWAWANRPTSYVKELVANVEKYLAELADAHCKFSKNNDENPFIWS